VTISKKAGSQFGLVLTLDMHLFFWCSDTRARVASRHDLPFYSVDDHSIQLSPIRFDQRRICLAFFPSTRQRPETLSRGTDDGSSPDVGAARSRNPRGSVREVQCPAQSLQLSHRVYLL
jgi:hypothetical protein